MSKRKIISKSPKIVHRGRYPKEKHFRNEHVHIRVTEKFKTDLKKEANRISKLSKREISESDILTTAFYHSRGYLKELFTK